MRVRSALTGLLSILLLSSHCLAAPEPPPISAAESLELLQKLVPDASKLATEPQNIQGHPGFRAFGKLGADEYTATIDAIVPRVTNVTKNGKETYKWPGIFAVGHRGALKFAPENTIASFKKAVELGAHYVEMDVRETKDGQLVIMHDPAVFRTTRGKGLISAMTLPEIKQLDAGALFSPAFAGEKIPTFDEVLDAIHAKAFPDVDLKAAPPEKIADALRNRGLLEHTTLAKNDPPTLRRVIESGEAKILIRPQLPKGTEPIAALQHDVNPPLVNIDDMSRFREIHRAAMKVFTNTMIVLPKSADEEENRIKAAIDNFADYIQTDRLDILVPLLKERGLYATRQ